MMDNYILAYYQAIKDGSVVVGKWIRLWYEKIVHGMEDGTYHYDAKRANNVIRFVEKFCRHHEGALAPQNIKLELWQKAFFSVVFGILDSEGNRQFREVILVTGRKNGKTIIMACVSDVCVFYDNEYGARIYYCAPKLEQASLCYDATYQMILKEPTLSCRAKKRRTDIYIPETNSSMKPLAFSAKKSDGLNISCGICDEFASWSGDAGLKFYEVLKSSQGARRNPLLLSCSTAGYVNDSVYDELIARATAVILGTSQETRLAAFLYMIDDTDKWNDINELRKSNPNLGVSISVDYLLEEIRIAESSPSKKAEFMTKYCNIKQNSTSAWFAYKDVDKNFGKPTKLEDFRGSYCVGGIDLSQTTDLTSACVVIEKEGKLNVFSKFFMPRNRLQDAIAEDNTPYNIFVEKGYLTLSGDNYVDYHDVVDWFNQLVSEYEIYPLQVGYDRYSAQYMVQEMQNLGFHMDDVFQGWNLTPVINETEGIVKDARFNCGDNNLLKSHFLNSALKSDEMAQKVRLVKVGSRTRIDGMAALLDAMTVRQKWWNDIGYQLMNTED